MKNNTDWAGIELKEHIENTNELHKHTGQINPREKETIELINYISNNFSSIRKHIDEDGINKIEDTKLYRDIKRNKASFYISNALENHNTGIIKRTSAKPQAKNDLSGLRTLQKLQKRLSDEIYICYLSGNMGTGKTDYALIMHYYKLKYFMNQ